MTGLSAGYDDGLAEPLPPYADPYAILAESAAVMLPPRRIKVSEAAARYRHIHSRAYWGPWRNETVPYMVEPMDALIDPTAEGTVFVGPAQSSKTEGLLLNRLVHAVVCDPIDIMMVQMDKTKARQFSIARLDRLLRECPEMAARVGGHQHNNIYDKRFAGMMLTMAWPTITHLSSTPCPVILLTDYDRMPDDVDGEGAPFDLAIQRAKTFGSQGMAAAESSPGRAVTTRRWTPRTPHEAPPTTGILGLYNRGDRRRWYWPCPHCGQYFEPHFGLLRWPQHDDVEVCAEGTHMPCPHCGAALVEEHKQAANQHGVWLADGQAITPDGAVTGTPVRSTIRSYWLRGPAATWQGWPALVRRHLTALREYERTGDESTLKATVGTDQAEPYWSPRADEIEQIDPAALALRREPDWPRETVPPGVRALVITVDVQGRYFDVGVTGFGEGLESWVIDQWQIATTPEGDRLLDPGAYAEDWAALDDLLERGWPLSGDPSREMVPLTMVVDSGGAAGVTGNAYTWWWRMRRERGVSYDRLMLLKGHDNPKNPAIVEVRKIEVTMRGKRLPQSLRLLEINTNRVKDMVWSALRRGEPGSGYVHFPEGLPEEVFHQLAAEERAPNGKWAKRKSGLRNEAFDHATYARAALLRPPFRADKADWAGAAARRWAPPQEASGFIRPRAASAGRPPPYPAAPPPPSLPPVRRTARTLSRGIIG